MVRWPALHHGRLPLLVGKTWLKTKPCRKAAHPGNCWQLASCPRLKSSTAIPFATAGIQLTPLFLTALAGARPMYIYMPSHFLKQYHEKYADAGKLAGAGRVRKGSKLGVPAQTFWPSVSPGKSGNANIAGLDEYLQSYRPSASSSNAIPTTIGLILKARTALS